MSARPGERRVIAMTRRHTIAVTAAASLALADASVVVLTLPPIITEFDTFGRGGRRRHSSAASAWTSPGEAVPYIADCGEDGALDAVTEFARLIDDLARRVNAALSAVRDTQQTAAAG
jgi:hypothetical protein